MKGWLDQGLPSLCYLPLGAGVRLALAGAAWLGLGATVNAQQPPTSQRPIELPDVSSRADGKEESSGVNPVHDVQFWLHMRAGELADSNKRYSEAIKAYSEALIIRPRDPAALWGRAHAYRHRLVGRACPRAAIEDLALLERIDEKERWIDARPLLVEWMADCGADFVQRRWDLALRMAGLPLKSPGRPVTIRLTLIGMVLDKVEETRDETLRATLVADARRELRRYHYECEKLSRPIDALAIYYRGTLSWLVNELGEAQSAYDELLRLHPTFAARALVEQRLADVRLKREVEAFARNVAPSAQAEHGLALARQELAAGRPVQAKQQLENVVLLNPGFARGHKELGRFYTRARITLPQAVEELKKAVLLDPSDYEAHELLGMVFLKDYPSEVDQARQELTLALGLRPDRTDLHLHLGRLLLTTNRERAREHFQHFLLAASPDHPNRREAMDRLSGLEQGTQEIGMAVFESVDGHDGEIPRDLRRILARAAILGWRDGQWQEVEEELGEARKTYPGQPALLNALAAALLKQGRMAEVLELWRESLRLDEDQVSVNEQLGRYAANEDERLSYLRRAADLGSTWARFSLAEKLWQALAWWQASDELDLYLRDATPYDLYLESAQALRVRIDRFFTQLYAALSGIAILVMAFPVWGLWLRWRGIDLREFMRRSPNSYPDVARVLSLIRHEVLKHNTAFLADVGQAMLAGEENAGQRAGLLSHRLFGPPGHSKEQVRPHLRSAIYDHFLAYVQDLEKIARSAGFRLNLEHKDPVFRSMMRSFKRVARTAADLRRVELLKPRARERVGKILIDSAPALGRPAIEALGATLAQICVSVVDASRLSQIAARVSAEDEFVSAQVMPAPVSGQGAPVRIFISDFEAIVANVLRNSLASSLRYGRPPHRVAIEMRHEIDEITGLETLAVRIKDRSPEVLTSEMLRGRYIERGMGITADLLARYDGSIAVEEENGWNKAVVLRFSIVGADMDHWDATAAGGEVNGAR